MLQELHSAVPERAFLEGKSRRRENSERSRVVRPLEGHCGYSMRGNVPQQTSSEGEWEDCQHEAVDGKSRRTGQKELASTSITHWRTPYAGLKGSGSSYACKHSLDHRTS